jgi:hypothetical protein
MSMSFLNMLEAGLPPGFRFHPRDDELVCDYLAPKVGSNLGFSARRPTMVDVDLNKVEPWDLPGESFVSPPLSPSLNLLIMFSHHVIFVLGRCSLACFQLQFSFLALYSTVYYMIPFHGARTRISFRTTLTWN